MVEMKVKLLKAESDLNYALELLENDEASRAIRELLGIKKLLHEMTQEKKECNPEKLKKLEQWKKDHPQIWNRPPDFKKTEENLFIKWLQDKGFSTEQIADIIDVVDNICTDCYDASSDCQCSNEE